MPLSPPITSPLTAVRERVKAILDAEFAADQIVFEHDKLDDAVGTDGIYAAVYPDLEEPRFGQMNVSDANVVIQLYGRWDKRVDPKQKVDPTWIETQAERIKRALQAGGSYVGQPNDWYFNISRIEFPDDPTGNKTRLVAYVTGESQNSAVIETTV